MSHPSTALFVERRGLSCSVQVLNPRIQRDTAKMKAVIERNQIRPR